MLEHVPKVIGEALKGVGPGLEHSGREAVPEGVRRDVLGEARPLGRVLDHEPGALPGEATAPRAEEQRRRRGAAHREVRPHTHEVVVERGPGVAARLRQPAYLAAGVTGVESAPTS